MPQKKQQNLALRRENRALHKLNRHRCTRCLIVFPRTAENFCWKGRGFNAMCRPCQCINDQEVAGRKPLWTPQQREWRKLNKEVLHPIGEHICLSCGARLPWDDQNFILTQGHLRNNCKQCCNLSQGAWKVKAYRTDKAYREKIQQRTHAWWVAHKAEMAKHRKQKGFVRVFARPSERKFA